MESGCPAESVYERTITLGNAREGGEVRQMTGLITMDRSENYPVGFRRDSTATYHRKVVRIHALNLVTPVKEALE